jgi:hypothetical protein
MKTKTQNTKKASLSLKEIQITGGGVEIAHLVLKLDRLGKSITIKLASAGHTLRIESSHLTFELKFILDWLDKDSKKENNLRTNESEIILFAKEMIKASNQLTETKTI